MASRRRLVIGMLTIVLAIIVGAGSGIYAAGQTGSDTVESASAPPVRCSGNEYAEGIFDFHVEESDKTPQQIAEEFAESVSLKTHYPQAEQTFVEQAERFAKIAWVRTNGDRVIVLSITRTPDVGWHLAKAQMCPMGGE